ncbi:hypothetical protein GCM10023191_078320 [Actinoallomurus oryzae]|uniref:Uncharacterized protein n=1 Tax=Actinoallomurus oryzae TaxID=502180 RepID=A0ABP8QXC9_9ACTN
MRRCADAIWLPVPQIGADTFDACPEMAAVAIGLVRVSGEAAGASVNMSGPDLGYIWFPFSMTGSTPAWGSRRGGVPPLSGRYSKCHHSLS